ncbi:hypothetical protein [Picosynechococcus sp. NKBG15041c]|uniref:hypothetical protein n=1 Tax=Picosynechococcus sp. NKBG15041c TaxID=1407650 RepID=UPI0003FDE245|nr:hypothetical protein [Picosynechococcus sp. NKBG15041c]
MAPSRRPSLPSNVDPDLLDQIPLHKVTGNFVHEISKFLLPNDLLILAGVVAQKSQLLSLMDRSPELIARTHPKVGMIIAYFPET